MDTTSPDESREFLDRANDRFFVISTIILPFLAQAAYLFDVYYYYTHSTSNTGYEGLFSSILSVFVYLQYSVPLESRYLIFAYHLSLWILSEVGTIGHIIISVQTHSTFHTVLYSIWATIDSIYFVCLIYCRVFSKSRGLRVFMPLEQENLFHFISRLEVILAIFIPVFFDTRLITLTRDNIAFFILFDFFAESYHRFRGITIKATLYIFVVTVTASVATEWIHIANHEKNYEIASLILELIAACFCYTLIIMQFFPSNFNSRKKRKNGHGKRMSSTTTNQEMPDRYANNRSSYGADSEASIFYF